MRGFDDADFEDAAQRILAMAFDPNTTARCRSRMPSCMTLPRIVGKSRALSTIPGILRLPFAWQMVVL